MSDTRNTKFVLKITIFLLLVGFVIFCANIVMFFIYTNIVRSSTRLPDKHARQKSFFSQSIAGHEYVLVKTSSGSLRGTKVKELGGYVYKFLGVPYAASPVEELRYKRPMPIRSGSPLVFQSYFANSRKVALRLSEILYCYDSRQKKLNPEQILDCMRNKTVEELMNAQKQLLSEREFAFSPSAKETFLPTIPVNVIINYERNRGFEALQELLIGVTNDEGSIFVNFIMPEILAKDSLTSNEIRNLLINNSKKLLIPESKARLLANTFLREAPSEETSEFWFKILSNIVGDLFITCPSLSFAEEIAKINKTVFFYVFNHKPSIAAHHPWMGVSHGSDIPFVFGLPLRFPTQFSGKDIEVSKTVIKAWSSFATSG
ncbi:acetylcholinesterase-like protein [Dinothrombium tinctorium]|uniref:Acetylcholinesterase-like protein n=1 Tax=Dinothrombium tinctorium TaxID=1965070 RepID=A0A3S3PCT7_9ACAR|nr:acetylcholinesterase-like protein [Dinothrombium tinctorium]